MLNALKRNTHIVFPILLFLIGLWYFCIRILGYHLEYIPGDLGDSRFINFLLEHGYLYISGKEDSFWDPHFMYPFHHVIALSDNMLGTVPIYSLFRLIGFSIETSYQLWWISICSLNYWVAWLVCNKLIKQSFVAAIVAYLFAFSLFNLGQLNYMQMIIRFPIPLVFYGAYKMIESPSLKYVFMYLFSIVIQLYCVPYTGFYALYFSLLFIVVFMLVTKQHKWIGWYFKKENRLYIISIFMISIGLLWLVLSPYHTMSKMVGLRLYNDVVQNLPTFQSFLFSNNASTLWSFLHLLTKPHNPAWWLQDIFCGIVLFITLIGSSIYLMYVLIKKQKMNPLIKTFIITSVILVLLHVRLYNNISLYALIFKLPGINSIRVPSRFMHVELFLLTVIFGYAISKWGKKILLLCFVVVFVDNMFNTDLVIRQSKHDLEERRGNTVNAITSLPYKTKKMVAMIDTINPAHVTHIDMMLAAQQLGLKTINGYSSYCPDAFGLFFTTCSEEGLKTWIQNQGIQQEDVLVISR